MKKPLALAAAILAALVVFAAAPFAAALRGTAATAQAHAPRLDAYLVERLASAQPTDKLVVFVRAADADTAAKAAAASGLVVFDRFERVGTAVAQGTPAQVKRLSTTKGLTFIEADRPIAFHSDTSHIATRADEARATIHDDAGAPFDGFGTTIAVVDSGIDGTHPMFMRNGESKVVRNLKLGCAFLVACTGPAGNAADEFFIDMTAVNDTDTPSLGGHGTHVAGIAAGYDVTTLGGRNLRGAAPEAKLVGLSIGTSLSFYGGNAGLNWVLEHGDAPCVDAAGNAYSDPVDCPPIKVVNNSYGPIGGGSFDPNSVTVAIQRALVAKGVTVIWAAGNGDELNDGGDGSDDRTNPPGKDPTNGVIMVANYDDKDTGDRNNQLDSSSSRGLAGDPTTFPDLSAPGANITSACRPYLTICATGLDVDDPNYNTIGGTSMAAPYVAGIAAVLREAKPSITPAEIELALEDTAYKFTAGAPYVPDRPDRNPNSTTSFDKGHGLIDVHSALSRVLGLTPVPPPPPTVCVTNGPVATDPEGDATDLVVSNSLPDSEPALDIRELDIAVNDAGDTTFTVTVTSLGEGNPQSSPNIAFDTYFTYNGFDLWAEAGRASDGTLTYKLGETVTAPVGTARLLLADVAGSFDVAGNKASVTVAASVLAEFAERAPRQGDLLTAVSTVARRAAVNEPNSQGQQADDVDAPCPYTYAVGAPPPPPFVPAPSEATVTVGTPYSWSGGPFESDKNEATDLPCERDETGPGCEHRGFTVQVPEGGGTLTVEVVAQNLVDDFDLAVYKPDGTLLGDSAFYALPEVVEAQVTESGVYTVVVTAWEQAVGQYDGTATLAEADAAPADGAVSVGSPYEWDGDVPPSNPIFGCVPGAAGDNLCDVRNVQVTVPAGGGRLTVMAQPTDDLYLFDLEIFVYDPAGNVVANGDDTFGVATWTVNVTQSGVYRIGIRSTATVSSAYEGTASITSS